MRARANHPIRRGRAPTDRAPRTARAANLAGSDRASAVLLSYYLTGKRRPDAASVRRINDAIALLTLPDVAVHLNTLAALGGLLGLEHFADQLVATIKTLGDGLLTRTWEVAFARWIEVKTERQVRNFAEALAAIHAKCIVEDLNLKGPTTSRVHRLAGVCSKHGMSGVITTDDDLARFDPLRWTIRKHLAAIADPSLPVREILEAEDALISLMLEYAIEARSKTQNLELTLYSEFHRKDYIK